jgi:23S rRNA (uridine2552-2'-O)-methyltransferase
MYERKDHYYQKAKKEGYRARSAYKLVEIQKKYTIIKKNSAVLDIGCAPGGWLQVIKKYTNGKIVGVDLEKIKVVKGTNFILGDITEEKTLERIKEKSKAFNVVISDIAPKTTGIRSQDQAFSFGLSRMSFVMAKKLLKKNGNFVVKTFQSPETDALFKEIRKDFEFCKRYVPKSTRESSKELYIVAKGFKIN